MVDPQLQLPHMRVSFGPEPARTLSGYFGGQLSAPSRKTHRSPSFVVGAQTPSRHVAPIALHARPPVTGVGIGTPPSQTAARGAERTRTLPGKLASNVRAKHPPSAGYDGVDVLPLQFVFG